MQFSLAQSLGKTCPTIDVIDVGAMALDAEPEYAPILAKAPCRVVGFEPVQAECDKLNAAGHATRVFLPYFIGDMTVLLLVCAALLAAPFVICWEL